MANPTAVPVVKFSIKPGTDTFDLVSKHANPGDGYSCMIGLYGQIAMDKARSSSATMADLLKSARVFAQFDHEAGTGVIRWSVGDFRFTRPMTKGERALVIAFDTGTDLPSRAVSISLDPAGRGVEVEAKQRKATGGSPSLPATPARAKRAARTSLRNRSLAAIRRQESSA